MSSTAVSALPRCVALRSKHDKSYLQSAHDGKRGGSVIELAGDDGGVMNPRCRFYLEPSEKHEGFVHVRCGYNNKYWVPQLRVLPGHGGSARWVIGTAHELEEDLSKPSCTLHKLVPIDSEKAQDGSTCRFLHYKLGKYACIASSSTSIRSYMHIASHEDEADGEDGGSSIDAFTLIDVSDKMQLPSYLLLKGDNGQYLQGASANNLYWLQYQNTDMGDPKVLHTTFTNNADGVVRIKSNYFNMFWRLDDHWIWPDSLDTTYNNPDTLFTVTTGNDFIALRNLGNKKFCRRFTTEGHTNVLSASVESITNEARVQYSEPVLSREIYNVDFRLREARTYTTSIDGLYSQTVSNGTSVPNKTSFAYTWIAKEESTWSATVSARVSIDISMECGIPFFAEEKIDISAEFSGEYTWGKTKSTEVEVHRDIAVDVPPRTKTTIKAIGSHGVCNIPFSYTQRDVLINGMEIVQTFTDGMYHGVKTSDVKFETYEEALPNDED